MVNRDRLADTFKCLASIDSISKEELRISDEIKRQLESMACEIVVDNAGDKTGSNTGNLIVKISGNRAAPPLMLNAHMDTVEPGKGVCPRFKNGVFTSDGTTILGADDKSAVAIIIEAIRVLCENNLPHGPLELVFTTCEEIGLLGAKNLDFNLISAQYGYALDTADTECIVTQAPAANQFEFLVHGRDAHAGADPEKGINAILLASKAISGLKLGRVDPETTCNIGVFEARGATNIVPNLVRLKGEVRSHDEQKLEEVTQSIVAAFEDVIEEYKRIHGETDLPRLDIQIENEFCKTFIPEDHTVVALAREAASNLGRNLITKKTGGGSDANIFFEKGIVTGVIGTGMREIHSVRESICLEDMEKTVALLLEIIQIHSNGLNLL